MTTAIAVFVKTPGLSSIKTRLGADIGADAAQALYRDCLRVLISTLNRARHVFPELHTYWAVAETQALPLWDRPEWPALAQGTGGLGERLWSIQQQVLDRHEAMICIGADCPQLELRDIRAALAAVKQGHAALGPARDGGFWLWAATRPLPLEAWQAVPWSTGDTLQQLRRLLPADWTQRELALRTDLDCVADLAAVRDELLAASLAQGPRDALLRRIDVQLR